MKTEQHPLHSNQQDSGLQNLPATAGRIQCGKCTGYYYILYTDIYRIPDGFCRVFLNHAGIGSPGRTEQLKESYIPKILRKKGRCFYGNEMEEPRVERTHLRVDDCVGVQFVRGR